MSSSETVFLTHWARETVQVFQERLAIADFLEVLVPKDAQTQLEQEQVFQNLETLWSEWVQWGRDFEKVSFPEDLNVASEADSNHQEETALSVRPLTPLASPNKRATVQTAVFEPVSRREERVEFAPSPFLRRVSAIMPAVSTPVNELLTNSGGTSSLAKAQDMASLPTERHVESPFFNFGMDALPPTPKKDFVPQDYPASTIELSAFATTPVTVKPLVDLGDAEMQTPVFQVVMKDAVRESSGWNLDLKSAKSPMSPLPAEQTPLFAAKNRAETSEQPINVPIVGAKMPSSVLRRVLPKAMNTPLSKHLNAPKRFEAVQDVPNPIAGLELTDLSVSKASNQPIQPIHSQKRESAASFPKLENPKAPIQNGLSRLEVPEQASSWVENNDIWQKPLGNLSNFAAFANIAVESEPFDDFSFVAEKTVMPLESPHEDSKKIQQNAAFSTADKKTVVSFPTVDKKTIPPLPTFEPTSVSAPSSPPQTPQRTVEWNDFFQKTTEEATAPLQTEVLLEALTQRIAQDFKRFYP